MNMKIKHKYSKSLQTTAGCDRRSRATAFTPFRVGANLLFFTTLALPLSVMLNEVEAFAQGPNANPPTQAMQAKNYQTNPAEQQAPNFIINDDNAPEAAQQAAAPAKQGGGLGNLFGSTTENEEPCTDCDKVKKAIKLSHASRGSGQHKRSFNMKKWSKTASEKMNMKMKKAFSRKHKVRTNYALCFNWK